MTFIKLTTIPTVANVATYRHGNYEIQITKDYLNKIDIVGYRFDDAKGLFYPKFTIYDNEMYIQTSHLTIDINKIDNFIESLQNLKEINELIPELNHLVQSIPDM